MAALTPAKIIAMSQASDPKQAIINAIGKAINEIEVFGPQVLVGTFIESEKSSGGIYKPQRTLDESLWQGCTGLVLKKGASAFKDEPENGVFWYKQTVEIGSWVVFRFSSAWEFHLNGVSVRMVDDRDIKAVISDPGLLMAKPIRAMGG